MCVFGGDDLFMCTCEWGMCVIICYLRRSVVYVISCLRKNVCIKDVLLQDDDNAPKSISLVAYL